jgi:uncharacterized Zn-binding protein involved in type VI secretion
MPSKAIASANMTIKVMPPVSGKVTVISQPSQEVKVNGSGFYRGPLRFSVSNIIKDDCGTVTPGTLTEGVIQPTASDTKVDNLPVIREGDKAENLVSEGAVKPVPGGSTPCVIKFTVEITDAGQTDVKGS